MQSTPTTSTPMQQGVLATGQFRLQPGWRQPIQGQSGENHTQLYWGGGEDGLVEKAKLLFGFNKLCKTNNAGFGVDYDVKIILVLTLVMLLLQSSCQILEFDLGEVRIDKNMIIFTNK